MRRAFAGLANGPGANRYRRADRPAGTSGGGAIAFDVVLSEPDRTSPPRLAKRLLLDPEARATLSRLPDNDVVLAKSFAGAPVITGFFLTHDSYRRVAQPKAGFAMSGSEPAHLTEFSDAISPLPALGAAASGNGFVSIGTDSDAIVRRATLIARKATGLYPLFRWTHYGLRKGRARSSSRQAMAAARSAGAEMWVAQVGQFEVPPPKRRCGCLHSPVRPGGTPHGRF